VAIRAFERVERFDFSPFDLSLEDFVDFVSLTSEGSPGTGVEEGEELD
jgi:hypothetical protein